MEPLDLAQGIIQAVIDNKPVGSTLEGYVSESSSDASAPFFIVEIGVINTVFGSFHDISEDADFLLPITVVGAGVEQVVAVRNLIRLVMLDKTGSAYTYDIVVADPPYWRRLAYGGAVLSTAANMWQATDQFLVRGRVL